MRKNLLMLAVVTLLATIALAELPNHAVLTIGTTPTTTPHEVLRATTVARHPLRAPKRHTDTALRAAFSVQGAEAQQTVWQENFDNGQGSWTLEPSADGYVAWEMKKSTGNYAYSVIDEADVLSLFIEGPYQVYRRGIAHATSANIAVPDNAMLHADIGYSQNFNNYAILTLYASVDSFATSTELWNSAQETGATNWRWHTIEVDLSAFASQEVQLRFTYGPGTADNFRTGGYMADFYIDGLRISGVTEINNIRVHTGEVVHFVDVSSGGDIVGYHWTFDGGMPEASTQAAPEVYYTQDGTYDVTLTITDTDGRTATVTRPQFVTVEGNAPTAKILPPSTFRYDDTHLPMVCPLVPVQYADASVGFPTQWQWTFTGATPDRSADENPVVAYDFMNEQSVTLNVANMHGSSSDSINVSVEYQGYISNILPDDVPTVYELDGEGSFPGSNTLKISAYAEKFSKPSRPVLCYGALVFFESASAEELADQISNIGVHLYTSNNGVPDQCRESMWWTISDLAVGNATTLRGTLFEFNPKVIDDEFFIVVDGIPQWNESLDVSFATTRLRNHSNTAYMCLHNQWRPVEGFFNQNNSCTSFYIMPLVAHSVLTLLPVGTDEVALPASGGNVDQQIFSLFGYNKPQDGEWYRFTGEPSGITLDSLHIAVDPLPANLTKREATVTVTDAIGATTITFRLVQQAEQAVVGDVNNDGTVDISDINILINIILNQAQAADYPGIADVNNDDTVDISDLNITINEALK